MLGVQPIARIVQPIIRRRRFCSWVLKIQRIEELSLGFEGNGKFRKYILQPRAHNSILPMSVDTLPLTRHRLGCFCTHHSLGGGGSDPTPRAISKTDGRRETDEAAFERSRRDASKPLSKI